MNCPECGAPELACEARYHECLVKEFTDAGFGSVHHLTVSAYMVQHSSNLTKEGWLFERDLLHDFLVNRKDPARVRQENQDSLDSGERKFKISSRDGLSKIDMHQWTKTILDVRLDDAATYCSDVIAWAQAVLADAMSAQTL